MYERENILRIFKETKEAMTKKDSERIGELSNQTTNSASLTHDPDNIAAAVVVYALSKILEKKESEKLLGWNDFYNTYIQSIDRIIESVEKEDDKSYRKNIEIIREATEKLSGELGKYIQEVFRNASINKASRIYEHGISMERTARLLGITLYELASYIGEKKSSNGDFSESNAVTVRSRIKLAENIFS